MVELRAQPVEDGHEVVDDDFDAVLGEVLQGGAVVRDVLVARSAAEFDVLVDVDGLDDLAFQAGGVGLADEPGDRGPLPRLARGVLVEDPHDARHTGDLTDVPEGDGVESLSEPAEGHFHF